MGPRCFEHGLVGENMPFLNSLTVRKKVDVQT